MATAKKAPAKRKTAKKPASSKAAPKVTIDWDNETQIKTYQAHLEAYQALRNAGVPVPSEIQESVDTWLQARQDLADVEKKTAEQETKQIEKENEEGPLYVRNLRNAPFSLRLDSQTEKKRIELKPRGQRGDMHPLKPGEEHDGVLVNNIGFVEVIPSGVAKRVIANQTHNIQATHTPLSILRNEKDEPYAPDAVQVMTEYNRQGVTVAQIAKPDPRNPFGDLVRPGQAQQVSQFIPTGDQPVTVQSGFNGQFAYATDATLRTEDDRMRSLKGEVFVRPEDAIGLSVNVDPVVKS